MLPLTNRVSCESRVVMVLDRVEKLGLQITFSKIATESDTFYLPTGVKRPRKEPEAEVDIKSSNRVLQLLSRTCREFVIHCLVQRGFAGYCRRSFLGETICNPKRFTFPSYFISLKVIP